MAEDDSEDLSAKQEQAIVALLNEPNVQKAAVAAGVGERTLYRWLKQPDFEAAYRKARREAFGQAVALLQRYSPLAANTLAKAMLDNNAPWTAKISAAVAVFRFCREGIELEDLAVRVAMLEQTAKDKGLEPCATYRVA